jgi:hypothetical protein
MILHAGNSFEMAIPFSSKRLDVSVIDPSAEPLFASHKEKIEAMQQWQDSPFRIMHIVADMSVGRGSFLKRIAQKVNCFFFLHVHGSDFLLHFGDDSGFVNVVLFFSAAFSLCIGSEILSVRR